MQIGLEKQKLCYRKRLCKNVDKLKLSRHITNNEVTMRNTFTNKMIINFDVLTSTMENRISSDIGGRDIVTKYFDRGSNQKSQLR